MCVSPDSGRIRMRVATSTLLHRRQDFVNFERNVTHQVTQVTQDCVINFARQNSVLCGFRKVGFLE